MKKKTRRTRLNLHPLEERAIPATLSNFLTHEHVDLNLGYSSGTGEWTLQARDDDSSTSYPADDALLYVGSQALSSRPGGSEFDFIGVGSGADYFRLPQSQNPALLYLGVSGYGVPAGTFDSYNPSGESKGRVSGSGRWLKMALLDVQGPGTFSVWQSGDTTPSVFMSNFNDSNNNPDGNGLDSTDGIGADDALWVVGGGHSHFNYGFSAIGRYEVTVKLSGKIGGNLVEGNPVTLYFSVGNVGQFQFNASSYQVNEGDNSASITVERVGGSDGQLTVDYQTADGTASTIGNDYTATNGTLTFADGDTSKSFIVPIQNDSTDESNESVNLSLSLPGPSNFADYLTNVESSSLLGVNDTAVLSILNDDSPGGNTAPSIDDILDHVTDEDVSSGSINFTVNDPQSALADLVVTASSSNQTLVPNANITLGGTVGNRTISILPIANLFGSTTITVTVEDTGGLTASDTFVLTVDPVNDAPIAFPQSLSTPEDVDRNLVLSGSDIELDPLTFEIVDLPAHGQILGSGANRTYSPDLGYTGPDSFTFRTNDGNENSPTVTVSINVTAENEPVANADGYLVGTGAVLRGNVLANDTDVDGDPLTASVLAGPTLGSLNLLGDGSFTYMPGANFAGTDSFSYTVTDDTNRTATGIVTIGSATPQAFAGVLKQGHVDIGIAYEDDAWEPHIHDEGPDVEYDPDGAILFVGPQAERTRPASSQFDFLGVAAGETIWQLPHSPPNPELLVLGIGTDEVEPGTFENGELFITLKAVNGPGHFSLWRSGDFGPEVFMTTADGISSSDTFNALEGGHEDLNWGFTSKGRYEVTIEAHAILAGGGLSSSGDATYYFSVDNLGRIEFEKSNVGVAEGNSTTVTVHRMGGSDGPATVSYATTPGTATIADYTPAAGDLVFADGETTKMFTFTTLKDKAKEPVETATLSLSVPDGSAAQLGIKDEATLLIDTVALLKVKKIVVNDGLKQRSNIETLTISFTRDTNIAALIASGEISNAIQLFTGATQVALAPNRFFYDAAKNTVAIGLTTDLFDPDAKTILADGRYELRLKTAILTSAAGGVNLLDKDKTLDDVHRFAFHRLEGDFNGDKKVSKSDEGQLKKLLGKYFWQRSYNFAFDLTGGGSTPDGAINAVDMTYLKTLFGRTV
ncbi:MAG: tandem-95 repeat protein [Gemmataceae bacterium]|nr:tandem-95 repeat protein [Gemmataceae bacterium]